ncbi:MAG: hypothetical protein M2R45_05242 [Verrucomicrobia subdivision 3 bacterium]|nr:hypothetical protein [Limisphaerales bacterium]
MIPLPGVPGIVHFIGVEEQKQSLGEVHFHMARLGDGFSVPGEVSASRVCHGAFDQRDCLILDVSGNLRRFHVSFHRQQGRCRHQGRHEQQRLVPSGKRPGG